jgi:hypothetical protein
VVAFNLMTVTTLAHAGPHESSSLLHVLTEPDHVLLVVGVLAAAVVAGAVYRRLIHGRAQRRCE